MQMNSAFIEIFCVYGKNNVKDIEKKPWQPRIQEMLKKLPFYDTTFSRCIRFKNIKVFELSEVQIFQVQKLSGVACFRC